MARGDDEEEAPPGIPPRENPDLVGHETAEAQLARSFRSGRMHHAWLITGPPGSGRSNAARAFAAGLQCERGGCGDCTACRTSLSGAHPDVTLVRTEQLSIGVDELKRAPIRIAVTVVPEDGKATEAARVLLAQALGVAKSRLVLIRGAKSRDKLFRLD